MSITNQEVAMKDGIALSPPNTCPAPEQRLPYVEPQLTVFGDLNALTHAVGNSGKLDGGPIFGQMASGL